MWTVYHKADSPESPPLPPRQSRDETMMLMAEAVAGRSTCSRLHVGAVIARDHRAISTGYNGAPKGMPHCRHDVELVDGCKTAVHAEANAIAFAARYGAAVEGAELFTTHQPCLGCAQLMVNSGIRRVVYRHPYRNLAGLDLLQVLGVETLKMGE
jgi:dCMP deaminase